MSKREDLLRSLGGNVEESMGGGVIYGAPAPGPRSTPAHLLGVVRSKDVARIATDRIGPDPDQPRDDFEPESLGRLAESMKARGQLQPIRVRWDEGRGLYVIICGERRWRAAQLAGLESMACVIVEGEVSPGELLAVQLVENALREDLKPIEQARAFKALMDLNGWSARQVARELAIAHPNVVRALALLDLPGSVQEAVEQGALPPATAYEVSKLDDPDAQREVARRVVAEGLSRSETIEAVKRAAARPARTKGRGAAKGKPRKVTARTFRGPDGYRGAVECRRGITTEGLIAFLEAFLASVRAENMPDTDEEQGGPLAAA